jgi:hypothetical protein
MRQSSRRGDALLRGCHQQVKPASFGRRKISAALILMNTENINPDDPKLSSLLRESRVTPSLPPRFQENVWRRIEGAEPESSPGSLAGLEALLAWVLRPRLAFAAVAALIFLGAFLGVREGTQTARQDARAQYLSAVAPNSLR